MSTFFLTLVRRDLQLAWRRRTEALLALAFFVVSISLLPLGVGPDPQLLRQMAPGVVWSSALLAALLSVPQMYAVDHADGTLDQLLLAPQSAVVLACAKAAAHWLLTGAPLVAAAPLVGLAFGLSWPALWSLLTSLLLGTPVLSLLGGLGGTLTLGLRSGGMLLFLLILPLCMPALIFGAGAVAAVEAGQSASGHFSLLGALLIGTALGAPWATAAALRISNE